MLYFNPANDVKPLDYACREMRGEEEAGVNGGRRKGRGGDFKLSSKI